MEVNLIEQFCFTKETNILNELSPLTKDFFLIVAKYCLEFKTGNQELAFLVSETLSRTTKWEYTIVPKDTLLFRGTKKIPDEIDRATYYTQSIKTANIYLPTNKPGFMNVYKTLFDLKIFKLDSLHNANLLLKETFDDKSIVQKSTTGGLDMTLYDIIRLLYTGEYVVQPKETKGHQIKRLIRNSSTKSDIIFSNWLCNNGFNGYEAGIMKQKLGHDFPAETMLCKPLRDIEAMEPTEMKKIKNDNVLKDIEDKYELIMYSTKPISKKRI